MAKEPKSTMQLAVEATCKENGWTLKKSGRNWRITRPGSEFFNTITVSNLYEAEKVASAFAALPDEWEAATALADVYGIRNLDLARGLYIASVQECEVARKKYEELRKRHN